MTDFETVQDNVVSASTEEAEPVQADASTFDYGQADASTFDYSLDNPVEGETNIPDTVGDLVDVEEKEDSLPTTTTGIEEVSSSDIGPGSDEAIVDGFPSQSIKPHVMNGSATPSLSTPEEGFEEITPPKKEEVSYIPEKRDDSLKSPLALWMMKQNLHPQVISLIYWQELQRTTGVFGGILFLLLSLSYYSVIGVVTTSALTLLVLAFLYRIGMTIVKAVQKTSVEHPFKNLLEEKIELSEECTEKMATEFRICINESIRKAQCLFLVSDTVASLKAMVLLWLVSYIAGCINFLTVCILGTVVVFTVPKLYEEKQQDIDQMFSLVMSKACMVCGMVEEKLPEKIKIYLKKDKKE